jgi:superfamily I DNA and RNA helicase
LINTFVLEQTSEEPDWSQLRILSAWGAPGGGEREGMYHEFCRAHSIAYLDFRAARGAFAQGSEFMGVCEQALSQAQTHLKLYDVVLVDEAQDFPAAFLRLCYEMLDEHKRLVYAYDELQNLSGESLASPEAVFGVKKDGSPKVEFDDSIHAHSRQDIILDKCYRNSRPVLVTAHSLGFGIYRKPLSAKRLGLVQMFDNPQLWEDIGYRRRDGALADGAKVRLYRPEESSPAFLESHSSIEDLVQFICFKDEASQAEWLVTAISTNIERDELRHDDIVVINPEPLTTRTAVGPIREELLKRGINSHLAGVDTDPDVFFQTDTPSVTFTGIFRAKGNEAGMVYIVNAQDCNSSSWNLASIRNRLFTAITRSKAWVRILGVGPEMQQLALEYEALRKREFELEFVFPTKEDREQLRIVHRDMSTEGRRRVVTREKGLKELVDDLESGRVHLEDLDDVLKKRLERLLLSRRDDPHA